MISCCPKDGVDRSSTNSSFNITVDLYNSSTQQPINQLDVASKISVILSSTTRFDSESFYQHELNPNRYTFYFSSSILDEDVSVLEVKLIDYQDQLINYKGINKVPYTRAPVLISGFKWNGIFCALNPIDWLLPKANALSCRSKDGSQLTWREGQLIRLDLYPEIY
jgi:hypothetical protein